MRIFSSSVTRPCLSSGDEGGRVGERPLAGEGDLLVPDLAHQLAGHVLEGVAGHDVDAALVADDEVARVAEQGPERRREGEASLVVELSFVDPDEHRANDRTFLEFPVGCLVGDPGHPHRAPLWPPLPPSVNHSPPLIPTTRPPAPHRPPPQKAVPARRSGFASEHPSSGSCGAGAKSSEDEVGRGCGSVWLRRRARAAVGVVSPPISCPSRSVAHTEPRFCLAARFGRVLPSIHQGRSRPRRKRGDRFRVCVTA